jgi:hypothetical protein
MSHEKRRAVGSFLVYLVAAGLACTAAEPPTAETQPRSQYAEASCVLRIVSAPDDFPLNEDTLRSIIESSGVLGAAAKDVLGAPAAGFEDALVLRVAEVGRFPGREGRNPVLTSLFRLRVELSEHIPEADARASRLLAGLCAGTERVLKDRSDEALIRRREVLMQAERDVAQAEQRLGRVHELQQTLYADAGQTELSHAVVLAHLQAADREWRDLEQKLAALRARQKALTEEIARIGHHAAARAEQDPVAAELRKVVELRERALQKMRERKQEHQVGEQEIADAEERLALARAELARQQQTASLAVGGSLLADLNRDVVMLAVDIAETEARRLSLRSYLDHARERKLLELASRYDTEIPQQLRAAEEALQQALRRKVAVEEQLGDYSAISFTVVGEVPGSRGGP